MAGKRSTDADMGARRIRSLVAGLIIMLCVGILYMWSVFQPYVVKEYGWEAGDVAMTSSIMISMFVVGNIVGGLIQKKLHPKMVVYIGCVLFTFGMYLTALIKGASPRMIYLAYSTVSGLGCGLTYTTVLSVLQKWYASRTGLITGLSVGSFGLSVVVLSPIVEKLLSTRGVPRTFLALAIAFIIICYIASLFVSRPSDADYLREAGKANKSGPSRQYSPGEMLRTPMFYFILVSMFTSSAAYLMLVPYIKTIATDRGMTVGLALIAVMLTGIASASGRILVPALSDKIGRSGAIIACCFVSAAACILMIFARGWLYLAAIFMIAFAYGGNSGTNPVISTEMFGAEHSGTNYGILMIALAASSVIFGKIAAAAGSAGSFTPIFVICAAVCCIPALAMLGLRIICKKRGQKI